MNKARVRFAEYHNNESGVIIELWTEDNSWEFSKAFPIKNFGRNYLLSAILINELHYLQYLGYEIEFMHCDLEKAENLLNKEDR